MKNIATAIVIVLAFVASHATTLRLLPTGCILTASADSIRLVAWPTTAKVGSSSFGLRTTSVSIASSGDYVRCERRCSASFCQDLDSIS